MEQVQTFVQQVIDNIEKVIIGKRSAIEMVMVALLCEGHVLLEDVPGSGKTMLARSIATSLGIDFKRVQCTPDLLPNDVTGVSIFNQKTGEFEFRPGPVFVNILLVGLGLLLLGEKVNGLNAVGIVLCTIGVALITYRPLPTCP